MGVGEISTPFCQRIHVGSACPGMTSKEPGPVVEIIDADHQDVGGSPGRSGIWNSLLLLPHCESCTQQQKQGQRSSHFKYNQSLHFSLYLKSTAPFIYRLFLQGLAHRCRHGVTQKLLFLLVEMDIIPGAPGIKLRRADHHPVNISRHPIKPPPFRPGIERERQDDSRSSNIRRAPESRLRQERETRAGKIPTRRPWFYYTHSLLGVFSKFQI